VYLQANGSDGALVYQGYKLHDAQLNVDCDLSVAADGQSRCLPVSTGFLTGSFSDASCTQKLALVPSLSTCPTPSPAYAWASFVFDVCTNVNSIGTRVYPVGSEFIGPIYNGCATCIPPTCSSANRVPGYRYYSVGAEMPASSFVAFTTQ